jgi:hypothetical protein
MTKHYRNYFWKEGIPCGLDPVDENKADQSYKVVIDPYRKRISLEKYSHGKFLTTIYDSALLNFRHLNQIEQQSWQKTPICDSAERTECLIRDQDDRVLFIETYTFEKNYCKKCMARSPQGVILSIQEMHYKILGEKENEVILYDTNHHPVLQKIYEADPLSGEFTTLIKEIRDMREVLFGQNQVH